jgi:hypothetical protein
VEKRKKDPGIRVGTLESRRKISMKGGFATPLDNSGED